MAAILTAAAALVGCAAEVTENCSGLAAGYCGWDDNSCTLTAEHGCREMCTTDDDCPERLSCRRVAANPRMGEHANGGTQACVPP